MLTLYHGDTSVCSQKVRLVLTEKGLDWEGSFIDLSKGEQFDPDYMAMNPNAVVPTLVHDGKVVIESTMINEYLDDEFPDISLKPDDAYARAKMRLWTKQLDDTIHYAINTVSFAIAFRQPLLVLSDAERKQRYEGIPDPARREKMKSLIEEGTDSPLLKQAIDRLDRMLADMEVALAANRWLTADTYCLADAGLTPYVNRMAMVGLSPMWTEKRSAVTDWYERAKGRPNYKLAILDHDPAEKIEMMNEMGQKLWPKIAPLVPA